MSAVVVAVQLPSALATVTAYVTPGETLTVTLDPLVVRLMSDPKLALSLTV